MTPFPLYVNCLVTWRREFSYAIRGAKLSTQHKHEGIRTMSDKAEMARLCLYEADMETDDDFWPVTRPGSTWSLRVLKQYLDDGLTAVSVSYLLEILKH